MNKKTPKILTYFLPTLGNTLWIITFMMVFWAGRRMMNGDGDLGFHITLGRYILSSGKIPTNELKLNQMMHASLTRFEHRSRGKYPCRFSPKECWDEVRTH